MKTIEERIQELINTTYSYSGKSANIKDLGWVFRWDNAKRRFGCCSPCEKTITISRYLAEANQDSFDMTIKNTVLHEIAHALHWIFYRETSHNWLWHKIAISIGCSGERCYSTAMVNEVEKKYSLICPNCYNGIELSKKPKCDSSCSKCSPGRFNPVYKMVLVENY
jgi:predicted SprT family Zn-dependent metalloprotease